ncbi:MAG: hypothetical protein OHK0018_12180 [Erythrobacter tepidarius]
MSNSPLASTKSALMFAAITIFGTLVMVGPGGGLLDRTMERFGQPSAPAPEENPVIVQRQPKPEAEPLDPAAGWGVSGEAMLGNDASTEVPASELLPEEASPSPDSPARAAFAPPQVRRSSMLPQNTGGPVQADSLGELVPRDGSGEAAGAEAAVPPRPIGNQLQ